MNVSGTATLIAISGSGVAGIAISDASRSGGGTITVGDGYTVAAGTDAASATAFTGTSTTDQYVAITPPAAPTLPTAAEYAAADPAAVSETDYVLDDTNKVLTIKTAKGAAWWSANGASYLDYTVLLDTDIDVSAFLWSPVGNGSVSSAAFSGSFNGQGHSISGLAITAANETYAGLFGGTLSGNIQNLCVSGTIEVTETDASLYIGGISGYLDGNSTLRNCCSHVDIRGAAPGNEVNAGGIVGWLNSGTIENCFNTGDVSGTDAAMVTAGGIYGAISSYSSHIGTVKNCYNTGSVTGSGSSMVGALGGGMGSNIVLENCYYLSGTASAAFGYGSSASCSSFTAGTADELLVNLNGWVAAADSTDYYTWTADNADSPVNGGYPVLGAAWGAETPIFDNCFGTVMTTKNENPDAGIDEYQYTFSGWYTAPNGGGTKLGDNEAGTNGTHYYAKWIYNGKTVRTTALDLTDISDSNLYGATKNGSVYTNAAEGWTWYAAQTVVGSSTYAAKTLVLSGLTINTAAQGADG